MSERATCTVLALASAAKIAYELAHDIAKDGGRANGRPIHSAKVIAAAKKRGLSVKKIRYNGTVARFIRTHPTGSYYMSKRRHAFAVIDGVVSDHTAPGSIVLNVWRFG